MRSDVNINLLCFACVQPFVSFPSSYCLPPSLMPYKLVMPGGLTGLCYRALHSGTHPLCFVSGIWLSLAVLLWSCCVSSFLILVYTTVVRHAGLGGSCCWALQSGTDLRGVLAFLFFWQCSDTSTMYLIFPLSFMPFSLIPGGLAGLCAWGAIPIIPVVLIFCCVAVVMSPVTPGSLPGTSWPCHSSGHL